MPAKPVHPSKVLAEVLAAVGVTPTELARQIDVPPRGLHCGPFETRKTEGPNPRAAKKIDCRRTQFTTYSSRVPASSSRGEGHCSGVNGLGEDRGRTEEAADAPLGTTETWYAPGMKLKARPYRYQGCGAAATARCTLDGCSCLTS